MTLPERLWRSPSFRQRQERPVFDSVAPIHAGKSPKDVPALER